MTNCGLVSHCNIFTCFCHVAFKVNYVFFVISYTVSTIEPCPLLINNYLVLIWYFKDFLDVIL